MNTEQPRWKTEQQNSIRTAEQLRNHEILTEQEAEKLKTTINQYMTGITPHYAKLINKKDPDDPIRKIVVPSTEELSKQGYYDTSGEHENTKVRGLQHKYSNTALILVTHICSSYCRYCFRKRLTLESKTKFETAIDWPNTLKYLKKHKEIDNVLVSGGDPFMLDNQKIEQILKNIFSIKHIKKIRIGTKMLAFNPYRFEDRELINTLKKYNNDKQIYIVSHYDHPRELAKESKKAVKTLLRCGISIVNQAVLLKGVNDNPETLASLHNKLAAAGIAPYYLFQMRPVKGSLHKRVPLYEGIKIFEQAKKKMSGLAKRSRYAMSHYTGKIEIFGTTEINKKEHIILKHHQARNSEDIGQIHVVLAKKDAYWLSDLMETEDILQKEKQTITNQEIAKQKYSQKTTITDQA